VCMRCGLCACVLWCASVCGGVCGVCVCVCGVVFMCVWSACVVYE